MPGLDQSVMVVVLVEAVGAPGPAWQAGRSFEVNRRRANMGAHCSGSQANLARVAMSARAQGFACALAAVRHKPCQSALRLRRYCASAERSDASVT